MSSATPADILGRWPSREAVAQDCGVEPIAVYRWERRERIPLRHFPALLAAAQRRNIRLTADELVGVHARVEAAE